MGTVFEIFNTKANIHVQLHETVLSLVISHYSALPSAISEGGNPTQLSIEIIKITTRAMY